MKFEIPNKQILSPEQLVAFQASAAHAEIEAYVQALNEAVVGVKLTDLPAHSVGVDAILAVLTRIEDIARETPPIDNAGSRFGNPAFRTFYDKVSEAAPELHATLPGLSSDAVPELATYFTESWGSRARIDYGSGMELNFLIWMLCLERLGVVNKDDHTALIIQVFWKYISIMRILQSTYWLEPAGSHGVWGLDDYHFLPFLFGSAQLRGHKYIRPRAIHDNEVVEEYAKHYMYFACIQFINSVKTASLRWHSPMLDDISAVKTWDKVNSGMHKMYLAEVLGKLPVMQHFLFGSLLPYTGPSPPSVSSEHNGHDHGHGSDHTGHTHPHGPRTIHPKVTNGLPSPADGSEAADGAGQAAGWGDCCGIPVPSAFGAAAAVNGMGTNGVKSGERRQGALLSGPGIRPVPFD